MKKVLVILAVSLMFASATFAQPAPSGFGDLNHTLVFTPGVGLLFPLGTFNDRNDLGVGVGAGLEYFVSPRLGLSLNYAYLTFSNPSPPAPAVSGENFHFLGMGARGLLFKDARFNSYLRATGGLYQASGGSKAGFAAGPGILYRASRNLGLFAEGSAHFVFDYGSGFSAYTAKFLGVSAGLVLTIPTGKKARAAEKRHAAPTVAVVKEEKQQAPGALRPAQEEEIVLSPVYFEFNRFDLRSDAQAVLQENLKVLRGRPGLKVELEGNCDELGTEEYNFDLGMKRAQAVRQFLLDRGIESSRLSTASYGKKRPAVSGRDASSRAKNRRVDFKIISR